MAEEKTQMYPLKFIPIPSRRPWGGNALIKKLGKSFVESDEKGNEIQLSDKDLIGESWELADMGNQDSIVENGWLAGNSISELMETYMERIVGDDVFAYYGRQFPLLIKFLDIREKLSVQVHPDDEVSEERFDSLGKAEIWYVMEAQPDSVVYMGFNKNVSAGEFYKRCKNGTVEEILNKISPKKGDAILIKPGTVHAADGGLVIAEIQESSDMTFRLYDWGREFNPATARRMDLDDAIDLVDFSGFDESAWIKGPMWDSYAKAASRQLARRPEFTVNEIQLKEPLRIDTAKSDCFSVYVCVEGQLAVQTSTKDGATSCELKKGQTVLVPADLDEFFLVPKAKDTVILEAMVEKREVPDDYINPDSEPFLEGEDYEGLEKE